MELAEFLQAIDTDIAPESNPSPESVAELDNPPKADLREKIAKMLADGPKPYEEILEAVGGDEDALREAIRGWKELIAYDSGEEWFWELQPATATIANFATDPVSIGERIGIKYEQEIPESLDKPIFWHKGTPLAYENDPPHIRLYAWATCHLFSGRPLAVDIEPVARLLDLSSREVREALSRLVKDGDLVRTWERGRELFRLSIQYPEGGRDVRFRAGSFCPGACGLDAGPHGQGR